MAVTTKLDVLPHTINIDYFKDNDDVGWLKTVDQYYYGVTYFYLSGEGVVMQNLLYSLWFMMFNATFNNISKLYIP
jgi:hypothetical protein